METKDYHSVNYLTGMKCFLCDYAFTKNEEPWYIFHKQIRCEFSIAAKLSQILDQEVNEGTAHSSFLCEICNSVLLEYESMEQCLQTLRGDIHKKYNSTLASHQITACVDTENYIEPKNLENNDAWKEYMQYSPQMLELSDIIEEDMLVEPQELDTDNLHQVTAPDSPNNTQQEEAFVQNEEEKREEKLNYHKSQEDISNDSTEYLESIRNLKHLSGKNSESIFYCQLCQKVFTCRNQFNLHMEHICTTSTSTAEETDAYSDVALTSYECLACELKFINYREFCHHRRTQHDNNNLSYECGKCKKLFNSQNQLNAHMNTHSVVRPYKCNKCSKDFLSKYALQAHVKIHTERGHSNMDVHKKKKILRGSRPYQCHTCGKGFARSAEVRDHERTHTGEKPFQCDICPLAFAQRSNLNSHKKYTHFKEALHKCWQCERSFKRRRLLDYHIQAVHTGERPHKCTICGMGFVYPEHFKKHQRKHTGQTPYSCEVCGKQFKSSDNRNTHRFVHSEKKPYECLRCGAGFMRKPQLLIHMSTAGHTADTIIVNQPQIKISTETDFNFVSEELQLEQQKASLIGKETSESIVHESTDKFGAMLDDGNQVNDVIIVDENFLKENLGKYLNFEDLNYEGASTITWVDIGETHNDT